MLTAFVHAGVERASLKRLEQAAALETALIGHMREASPDQGKGDSAALHLRIAAQVLRDQGLADPLPVRLWRIVRGIAYDGRGEDGAAGSLSVRKRDPETVQVTLQREWGTLEETARIRRDAAGRLLEHLLSCLPSGSRGHGPAGRNHARPADAGDRGRPGSEEQGQELCQTAGPRPVGGCTNRRSSASTRA